MLTSRGIAGTMSGYMPCTTPACDDDAAHVICMQGMGEPLHNYEPVRAAVRLMTDSRTFALSRKHVTISTVGVVPRIKQLATDLPVSISGEVAVCECGGWVRVRAFVARLVQGSLTALKVEINLLGIVHSCLRAA